MQKKILGRTGLEVGALSLGAAFVTRGEEGLRGANTIVSEAVKLGINLVDTSADYGDSEAGVGMAMKDINQHCVISTKLGPVSEGFDPKNKGHLREIVEKSLTLLHRDTIDILMIHEPDRPGQFDWWDDLRNFRGPVSELLEELKKEGLVRFTGLGGTTAYEIVPIIATGFYDVVLTAFNSSMLWREALIELMPEARRQGMGILMASPTQQGWLAERYDKQIERANSRLLNKPRRDQLHLLYKLVDDIGIPIPELSLRWALTIADTSTTVLTGPRDVKQLRQNMRAANDGALSDDIMNRIDEIASMVPYRPYEEPFGCPFRGADFDIERRPGRANR